jgi:hypothetical protein
VGAQDLGEDGDGVVALEGDEGRRAGQALAECGVDLDAERGEGFGKVAQERDPGAVGAEVAGPFGELGLAGGRADEDAGQARVGADGLDDRHGRLRGADEKQEGCRAVVDEGIAERGDRGDADLDESGAARAETVAQDAGAGFPVDRRLGCDGDAGVARGEEEVGVDLPAVGLGGGDAGDPVGRVVGEGVEDR